MALMALAVPAAGRECRDPSRPPSDLSSRARRTRDLGAVAAAQEEVGTDRATSASTATGRGIGRQPARRRSRAREAGREGEGPGSRGRHTSKKDDGDIVTSVLMSQRGLGDRSSQSHEQTDR